VSVRVEQDLPELATLSRLFVLFFLFCLIHEHTRSLTNDRLQRNRSRLERVGLHEKR
jgi:hypothetical protein